MRICVHNCGRPAEECECRKENDPTDLGTSDQNIEVMREALQQSLGTSAELKMKPEFTFQVPKNMQQDYIQRRLDYLQDRIDNATVLPETLEIKGIQMHGRQPHYFHAEVDTEAELAKATPEQLEGLIEIIAEQAAVCSAPLPPEQQEAILREMGNQFGFSSPLMQDPLSRELRERIGLRWLEKMVLAGKISKYPGVTMEDNAKESLREAVRGAVNKDEVLAIIEGLEDMRSRAGLLGVGYIKIAEKLDIPTEVKPEELSITFGAPNIREQFPEAVRGLAQKLLEDSNFSSALAHYNPQLHPAGLLMLKEDGRQMSPEEMEQWIAELQGLPPIDLAGLENNFTPAQLAQWQLPTPELIRQLESQGVDCDLLRMYPHEVKPLDLSRISSQCRNNDIAELYPKTYHIKNLGGNYQRILPRYVYKGRTKRGPRRFRLQIVSRKESV